MRSTPPATPSTSASRLVPWLVVAVAVAAGVYLAFRFGLRVTPLLDGLR